MSKDEVSLLVDLIQNNPILTSKETNASTNKLKEACWASLTDTFNSKSGQIPRHREQLKLKWDNLKKAARKRAANIRMNHLKVFLLFLSSSVANTIYGLFPTVVNLCLPSMCMDPVPMGKSE